MKKAVSFFLCCTLFATALAGCGGTKQSENGGSAGSGETTEASEGSEEGAGDEEVSGTITIALTEDRVQYYEPVVEAFQEEYPDVEVELATSPDFTAMNQAAQAAHQAGDDYDIITVNHVDTMTFQKAGMLYPMYELAEKDGINFDEVFMGSLMDGCKVDGQAWTVPTDTDVRIMAYNKELFEKYNLEYPETIEDMLECGKTMTQNGDYLFCNPLTSSTYQSTYEMGVFMKSMGGNLYVADDDGKFTATVDTPQMQEYLEFVQELIQYMPENSTTITGDEARNQFCSGNIGMYIFGPWEYGLMDMDSLDFTVELGLIPAGEAGSCSTSGGFQLGIGSGTDNLTGAWTFIKWLTSRPDQIAAFSGTNLPTIEAAYEEGDLASEKYDIFKQQLQTSSIPQIPVANLSEIMDTFDAYWQDLLFGNMTAEEVCSEAQPAVQELLDENNE